MARKIFGFVLAAAMVLSMISCGDDKDYDKDELSPRMARQS